jgi:small subunit ribosomal protein S17
MARRRLSGKVMSNKMVKTVVVQVENSYRHPLYGKVVHRAARFKAHDEKGCQMGDTVVIVESRPISKEVRWVVEDILSRKLPVELPVDVPAAAEAETGGAV